MLKPTSQFLNFPIVPFLHCLEKNNYNFTLLCWKNDTAIHLFIFIFVLYQPIQISALKIIHGSILPAVEPYRREIHTLYYTVLGIGQSSDNN